MMEFEELLKYRIETKANEIQENAEMLKKDMERLVSYTKTGLLYKINGLGEVQKQGIEIDRQCAELRLMLCTLSEFVTWYESKNKEEKRDESK